ncbi:MAG: creatininase family protein [Deltaproteobacteria bacterium]|nr:creatininase family protein [Deltaproteobacteria bacterium]MBW2307522.1 creatininase family protein [Deltaproteobacteria bacterium]
MENVRLEEMTWEDCKAALEETDLVIVPIGAVEQHGPHLPLGTDAMNIKYSALKAAERCNVVIAPAINVGVSQNHMDFPGTITLRPETLIDLIIDYCESLSAHGFRRFILLNGHGGNNAAVELALIKLRHRLPGHIFGHAYGGRLKKGADYCLEDEIRYHADEGETSRMLMTAPHLVRMERAVKETPRSGSGLYVFQASELSNQPAFFGLPRTKSCTKSGVFGNALIATPEKGKTIHAAIVDALCEVIEKLKRIDIEVFDE